MCTAGDGFACMFAKLGMLRSGPCDRPFTNFSFAFSLRPVVASSTPLIVSGPAWPNTDEMTPAASAGSMRDVGIWARPRAIADADMACGTSRSESVFPYIGIRVFKT